MVVSAKDSRSHHGLEHRLPPEPGARSHQIVMPNRGERWRTLADSGDTKESQDRFAAAPGLLLTLETYNSQVVLIACVRRSCNPLEVFMHANRTAIVGMAGGSRSRKGSLWRSS